MVTTPFLYINIIALCCFLLMFVTFLAAKKTPEIWAFMIIMFNGILWSGSSVLMRLQTWPGLRFWYTLSLATLFFMELFFFYFVHSFAQRKGKFTLLLFTLANLALLPGTISGFFLEAPTPVVTKAGYTVYLYNLNWHLAIPCFVFAVLLVATVFLLRRIVQEQGARSPGIQVIIISGLVMLIGNLLQVCLPNNIFPFDMLSGIACAVLLMYALYKRRLFLMTLIVSRSLLMILLGIICALSAAYFISPVYRFVENHLGLPPNVTTIVVSVGFAAVVAVAYILIHKLINAIFTREEQQNRVIQQFSMEVSRSLSTLEIMEKLGYVLQQELPLNQVYICLLEDGAYRAKYSSRPLASLSFTISGDSPQIAYLKQERYFFLSEFRNSPLYLSMWETEKNLLSRLNIDCVAAMGDESEIVGLLLLSQKDRSRNGHAGDVSFLTTVSSIASIAMKNAALYEQMFREARIDPLTGVYNYRFFMEQLEEAFRDCGKECLTLLYVDVDDFKLYNQLYGVNEGDEALCRIGKTVTACSGENATVFRTSGKVFTVLLPRQDTRRAYTIAQEIQRRVEEINGSSDQRRLKTLSVSIGICSAPYAASTAKELMNNADLATYHAKQSGKNKIMVFRGASGSVPQQLAEKTDAIVDRVERGDGKYETAMSMISALTAAIDAKDHYTYAHSKNVARYAANLAVAIGLNDDQVRTIYAAGLLHDIGKISIPEDILNKSGRLTEQEYTAIQGHVNNSIDMIRHLPDMDYVIPAVLGHHERWDGRGYPRGIAGEEIPVSARCLSVADMFDAMTTDRPYRKGLPLEYALSQIDKAAGTQLDPQLAVVFVQLVRGQSIPLSVQAQGNAGSEMHV